jgi:two-component system sensor histidine kinase BarA
MRHKFSYLYVEDDALSREVMETLLVQVVGVKSLALFEDSTDFMARLQTLDPQPDLILLDIFVGPHDGHEMLAMLRNDPHYQDIRVIAVTASVMSDEVRRLRSAGFDGALAKPLDMVTFPDLIQRLEAGEAVWQIT